MPSIRRLNSMRHPRISVALLSLFALGRAAAETPALTWQDCVRLAARGNPDLLSALRAMEASRAQYRGSYNGVLPQLSLSNSYTKNSSDSKLYQAQGKVGEGPR